MKKKKTKEFKITQGELEVYKFEFKKKGGKIQKMKELDDVPISRYNSPQEGRSLID